MYTKVTVCCKETSMSKEWSYKDDEYIQLDKAYKIKVIELMKDVVIIRVIHSPSFQGDVYAIGRKTLYNITGGEINV